MLGVEYTTDEFALLAARAAAPLFDSFANANGHAGRRSYEQLCEVIALPGQPLGEAPRPGDVLVRRGESGLAHAAVIAAHELWPLEHINAAGLRPEGSRAGLYAHVVEGGPFPHSFEDGFARLVADPGGRVPHNQLILRPRRPQSFTALARPEHRTARGWAEYEPATGIIPPLTPAVIPPRGLTLVRHCHQTRYCADGKQFKTGIVSSNMSPPAMNPGFLRPDGEIEVNDPMQRKLLKLLKDEPKYAVMMPDKIRVALVDLTGDKICRPLYAGYRSTKSIYSASTIKYAVLYAAHQLVFDLNDLARIHKIKSFAALDAEAKKLWAGLKCKPDLDWLVTIDTGTGAVSASKGKGPEGNGSEPGKNLQLRLEEMIKAPGRDMAASELILRIGFEYIASAVWSAGLYHPGREGLWIGNTFEAAPPPPNPNPACHSGQKPTFWAGNPFKNPFKYNSNTALSAVTFFTLLAQRRLVSEARSREMEDLLRGGCYMSARPPNTSVRATKCGLLKTHNRHEVALLEGTDPRRLYAFAVLTVDKQFPPPPGSDPKIKSVPWPAFGDFVADLDKIIRENNT